MNITDLIKDFRLKYKTEVKKVHSKDLKSFDILINQLPKKVDIITRKISENLIIKGSIGAGVNTYYPWLGIFDNRVSTGATNGFYVVLLFSNDFNDIYLTFNQGSTVQSKTLIESNRDFVYEIYNSISGFTKGQLPAGSLVKAKIDSSSKNGKKYEETNIYYKKYEIENLDESIFNEDLCQLLEVYIKCADMFVLNNSKIDDEFSIESEFEIEKFMESTASAGLIFTPQLITRFIASLCTKPFVILSGLSGSGKTKLAQSFVQWICQDDSQYCIVPVGADWTNREPLLGYPNALKPDDYIKPDNGALELIIQANKHPELPYFLTLDEMNLSHVERYFADFLSVMESKGEISLFSEGTVNNAVPAKLALSSNLFIIGTVNIDETTYMFSPKVLDRANAIEFRVTKAEIEKFFEIKKDVDMNQLKTKGASMAQSFLNLAENKSFVEQDLKETHSTLVDFFEQLKKAGSEFGYRSASEIIRLINQLTIIDAELTANEKLDIAIMQKLLPKLHGSRRKLCPVLITLGGFCVDKAKIENIEKDVFAKEDFNFDKDGVIYPISLEKITRMYKGAIENGFASYAEA